MVLEAVSQIHERMMRANGPREEDPFPGNPYPTFRRGEGRLPGYTGPWDFNHGLESPRFLMEEEREGEYETIGDIGKTRNDNT